MSKYQSFVSEHTVEYILIPRLVNILKQQFESVIPVFPWITREGNSLSKSIHGNDKFKIVSLFPRRPKYELGNEETIFIKINIELIESLNVGLDHNLPIIAGCPLIKSLWELDKNVKIVWINLNRNATETYHLQVVTNININNQNIESKDVFESEDNLLKFINDNCKTIIFNQAIEIIRILNNRRNTYFSFPFRTGYRPVYFLLKDFIDR